MSVTQFIHSKACSCVAFLFPSIRDSLQKWLITRGSWPKKHQSVAKRKSDNAGSEIPIEHKWSDRRMS